jgi:hypothetical protein
MNCEFAGFILQDIFLLIGLKGRTGELVLESGNNIGTLVFHDGNILQAFSPYSHAIGDLLVEDGIITEAELLETLKLQKQSNISPIGSLFMRTGKVSFEAIEMMVHAQIRQAVKEFITWDNPRISFLEKDVHPFDRIHLPVQEFLLPDTVKLSQAFFTALPPTQKQVPPASASTAIQ